jgi:malic enzyme
LFPILLVHGRGGKKKRRKKNKGTNGTGAHHEASSAKTLMNTGDMDDDIVKTDLLIVGAGPAGAALACFLAAHGMHMHYTRDVTRLGIDSAHRAYRYHDLGSLWMRRNAAGPHNEHGCAW